MFDLQRSFLIGIGSFFYFTAAIKFFDKERLRPSADTLCAETALPAKPARPSPIGKVNHLPIK